MMLRRVQSAFLVGAALTVISCGPPSVEPSPEPSQKAESAAHPQSDMPHTALAGSPPVALCKNVVVVATNTCTVPVSIDNGSSDPDGDLVGCTQSPAGPYAIGNTAVTLTCTDRTGLNSTCSGTVSVIDHILPVVHVTPPSQTLQCFKGAKYAYSTGVTADDLCQGMLPSANISWTGTVNMEQPSSYTVTYQAKDSANNLSAPVPRTVTVVDTVPPALSLQGGATVTQECGTTFTDPGAQATDLCLGALTGSIMRTGSVNTNVVGTYSLRYDVSDGYNSANPLTRTVNVADTSKPMVTIVGPLSQTVECGAPYADPGATATDLCAGNLLAVATIPLNPNLPGTYVTQYKATDPSGNTGSSSQSRTITVADTLPPTVTLNGPASMNLECATPFQDPGATASDQCAGNLPVTTSGSVNPLLPGVQALTYSANDGRGHSASKTRTVAVSDTLPPVITLNGPDSQTLECDGTPYVDPGATASDTCSGDLTSSIVASSNLDQSKEGEYSITYSVQDAAGHTSTAVRQLTVGPCVRCVPLHLSDYTLFLREDYTGGHDVEGKVAAGGSITLTDFAVGVRVADNNIANTLVAGGNLTLSRGGVWGDAWYGGSYSTHPSVVYPRGTAAQGTPIDFAARFTELSHLSSRLGALPAHGVTTLEPWGGIMLRGTDPSLNVFDVDASAFTGAKMWSIDAPAGSLVVVNIRGASATFTGFGTFFSGGIDQHGVLYNFVDATQINAHGFGFWGTVLAPQAHVTFNDGSWDGGIYARSLTGNAEGHINPLNDREVCP